MDSHTQQRQTGAALIVALLVLLVLTILGVVSLNNLTMEERMAANFRSAETTFQTAESALKTVVFDGTEYLMASGTKTPNAAYVQADDPFGKAMAKCQIADPVTPKGSVDPTNVLDGESLTVTATVTYLGWNTGAKCVRPGDEMGDSSACATFEIETAASLGGGRHKSAATHVQEVTKTVPLGPGTPCHR